MWKEVVVAYFKADLAFACRHRVKPQNTLVMIVCVLVEIRTEGVSEALPLERIRPGP
jgi:hypothetical protein